MAKHQAITPDDPYLRSVKLLTAKEVGRLLNIHVSTVCRWTQRVEHALPCVRLGRGVTRFRLSDLEQFIADGQEGRSC